MISDKYHSVLNYRYNYMFLSLCIAFIGYQVRFIQDDAFISFRYAENFANGHGLTWNIGESPVEGYTNFLWVILLALGAYVGAELVKWSMLLSMIFGIGTIIITYHLAFKIFKSRTWAIVTILILGTNYTFLAYMTGGLESQLNAFLIVLSIFLTQAAVKRKGFMIFIWLSLAFTLCILTRLDSVLFLGPVAIYMSWELIQSSFSKKEIIARLILLAVPATLIIGVWFSFKIRYYGDILPNTFYVKSHGIILYGFQYALIFAKEYAFFIFVPFFLFFINQFLLSRLKIILMLITFIWLAYVIKVGGDFMEFRFFVPLLPVLSILFASIIRLTSDKKIRIALLFLLVSSSTAHAIWFSNTAGIESIRSLNSNINDKNINWKGIGVLLGKLFNEEKGESVKIAISPAGAIPYYSGLYTIDMHGLNDRWIAKNGVAVGRNAGHYKFTTLEYLLSEEVNLIIGHPQVKPIHTNVDPGPARFFHEKINITGLPKNSKILEIPIDGEYRLEVLYIKEHPLIDKFIREYDIKLVSVGSAE